ncbi:hypothetical protein AB6A40_006337 [Gnathostoma spinigerum]|uniref:Methyltransferase domain-containing protein n=1 Tax=Gnathostoma spinigerum TaxID=75299 RepID=A0ABD6EI39_9BILA
MDDLLQYNEVSYWNERFRDEQEYDWLCDFDGFSHCLLPYMKKSDRIAHLGCGNSRLSIELFNRGYKNITNIDYSPVLIEKLAPEYPEMKFICDDIRSLSKLPSNNYDIVIEKASIESLMVAEKDPWNPSEKAVDEINAVCGAIQRIMKPNSYFFSISFTQPHFRVPLLLRARNWNCEVDRFGSNFHYFCYRLQKGKEPNMDRLRCYFLGQNSSNHEKPAPQLTVMEETNPLENICPDL